VVVLAIAIAFAVGFVVLLVVADEIGQREAVVRGDEIDARVRAASALLVEIAAAGDARRELGHAPAIAEPEAADRVAVLAVPLGPLRREVADLLARFEEIPGLGNQLHLRYHRVL